MNYFKILCVNSAAIKSLRKTDYKTSYDFSPSILEYRNNLQFLDCMSLRFDSGILNYNHPRVFQLDKHRHICKKFLIINKLKLTAS